jgi:uncharacterized delta-60 repeat protein
VGLNGLDHGFAMALQPSDGKIVVVGSTHANPLANGDLAVVRRSPDGSPDMAFAGTGQQIIDYAGGNDQARAVALDRDGRIVIAGFGNTANDVALQRFLPDGTPELSVGFKLDGLDRGEALALQPDGKILIAGSTWPQGGDQDLAILRTNPDGGLDTTFAGDGKRTIDYDGFDAAQAIALQPDGRIVIVGYGYPTEDILVDRLLPDGSDDPSFKVEGSPGIDLGGTDDDGNAVALQPDGKILVAGTTYGAGGSDAVILRLQPGGALDTTFDGDGKQTLDLGGSDGARALALQPDGRIIVAGHGGPAADLAIARLQDDLPGGGVGDTGEGGGGPGARASVPRCTGRKATIVGTAAGDRLRGTRRSDVIATLGGSDVVKGGRGQDLICSGAGNDRVLGDSGNDRRLGQRGKDRLLGGGGKDRLDGGAGKDRLAGGPGRDRCLGGPGRDWANCETKRGI